MKNVVTPAFPIKRFALGIVTTSLADNTQWIDFCNPVSFDTHEEAEQFIHTVKNWNQDGHSHNGIIELSGEDIRFYTDFYSPKQAL
jgi:hypothetical protein